MTRAAAERLTIDGPAGPLETIVEEVEEAEEAARACRPRFAVVCHPHSLFGGTMDNKVVTTLARAMQDAAIPTLRFNFRGVGQSGGEFDAGGGETEDARAAAAWGAAHWPGRELVLAGFSFGAYVALRLAQDAGAAQLVTVAPPVVRFDFTGLKPPDCPWLVVQGDADEVVNPREVFSWADGLKPRPHLLVMPGVGHFFHGRLPELRDAVIHAVREN